MLAGLLDGSTLWDICASSMSLSRTCKVLREGGKEGGEEGDEKKNHNSIIGTEVGTIYNAATPFGDMIRGVEEDPL